MQITLVLPNLIGVGADALAAADAPAPARLLSASTEPVTDSDGMLGIACASVGIARQDDWPVAPWLARAAGIDPGTRYWLCAQPMTVGLERGEARLTGSVGDLDAAESAALLSRLSSHFAPDGIEFADGGPSLWLVSIRGAQRLVTTPPDAAVGRTMEPALPRGADGARWRRWQSEMQMLLFEHPVNEAREREGRPAVNYVWLWGGGTTDEAVPRPRASSIFTRAPLLRDLARATGRDAEPLPASFEDLRKSRPKTALVWFDELTEAGIAVELAAFDAQWGRPIERALDEGDIAATVVAGDGARALRFAPRPARPVQRLLRRWSRAPRLAQVVAGRNDG